MELEHKLAQDMDLQTSSTAQIQTEICNNVEGIVIKTEPELHSHDDIAMFTENRIYSRDGGISVDVKTDVSYTDEYENMNTIHKSPHADDGSYVNGNYVGGDLICDTIHVVKPEPADECSATTDDTFIIEIDTCKDEYYERHGYPTNDVTVNTGEKSYNCHVCEISFNRKGTLTDHIRTHTGEKPYKCSVCGVGFTLKCNLKTHTRRHTGEKPHMCLVCEVSFADRSSLIRHKRIHTGEKPYICTVCGVRFAHTHILQYHMTTHTVEKSHVCTVCGVGFPMEVYLTLHIQAHTGEEPYICSVCGEGFTQKCDLGVHMGMMGMHIGEKSRRCVKVDSHGKPI